MVRRLSAGAVSFAALAWGGCAYAEESRTAPEQDIIVTGEKTSRSLQDTVTSVAVTTPERVRQENLVSLQDVFQRTANVAETYGEGGFAIRGIAGRGLMSGEDAALATIFIDGAAVPSAVVHGAPTDLWDVAQIEILRGPQSTLQGLNALAGAVVLTTAAPTMEWNLRGRAMVRQGDERQLAVALGGPVVPRELAFRVTAEKRDADGFIWNPTRRMNENLLDSTQIRAKLLWTPEVLPGFEARIGYTHFDRFGGYAFSFTDTSVAGFADERRNYSNEPNDSDAAMDIAMAQLRYDMGGGFSLAAISAYNEAKEANRYDNDQTAVDGGAYRQSNRFRTFTQELRLNYESERLSGLVGLFLFHRKHGMGLASQESVATPLETIGALLVANGFDRTAAQAIAGIYGQALPVVPVHFSARATSRVKSHALFGDARLKLSERLSVIVGFRYDREVNRLALEQDARFAGAYPDPATFAPTGSLLYLAVAAINHGVGAIVGQANGSASASDRTFEAFLPKAGIEMAWSPAITAAFTVQRGYRSGGSSSNIARSSAFAYDPEFTWNYEGSLRSVWLEGALKLNANAFYVDWTDQQVAANFGSSVYDTHIVNAGRSHLYGFEIEASHRPGRTFDWYATVGYTRTKFEAFVTTAGSVTDYAGLEFAHAPRWTLAGGVNFRPGDHVTINLNASHRSGVFSEIMKPQRASRAPARTLVNARVAFEVDHWMLSTFVSNIFDDDYYQYRIDGLGRAVLGNPRVVGVAIEARW